MGGVSMIFNFAALHMVPLTIFALLFNSKSLFVFLLESLYLKKWPRLLHLFMSFCSFVGVFLLMAPLKALRPDVASNQVKIDFKYVAGCVFSLIGAISTAVTDIYGNHQGMGVCLN